MKDDLGFGDAELGAAFTLGFLVSAVTLPFAGPAADRIGPRPVIRLGVVLAATSALWLATITSTFALLLVGVCIVRAAEALVQPATNTLVSASVPPQLRGRAMGLKQAAIPLSTALAGATVPLLGDRIGWEGAFLVAGSLAIPTLFLIPNPAAVGPRADDTKAGLWRTPHLRVLALAGAFSAAGVVTVSSFLTTAAKDAGFSEGSAGLLLTVGGLVMVASRLVWGLMADRVPFDRFLGVAGAVGIGSSAYLAFATESKPWIIVGTIIVFGAGWSWPGLMLLGVIERHPDEPGAASSVIQTAVRLGALTSPLLFGATAEAFGYGVAWFLPFGFALAGASLFVVGARLARQ